MAKPFLKNTTRDINSPAQGGVKKDGGFFCNLTCVNHFTTSTYADGKNAMVMCLYGFGALEQTRTNCFRKVREIESGFWQRRQG